MIGSRRTVLCSTDTIEWIVTANTTSDIKGIALRDTWFRTVGDNNTVSKSKVVYNNSDTISYLSSLLNTLEAPSGYELPSAEPLLYLTTVTGTITYDNSSYTLSKLKVSNNGLTFIVDDHPTNPTFEVQINEDVYINISNLIINGTSEENHVTALSPKKGNGTGYIGSDGKRFKELYVDYITATTVYGKTYAT